MSLLHSKIIPFTVICLLFSFQVSSANEPSLKSLQKENAKLLKKIEALQKDAVRYEELTKESQELVIGLTKNRETLSRQLGQANEGLKDWEIKYQDLLKANQVIESQVDSFESLVEQKIETIEGLQAQLSHEKSLVAQKNVRVAELHQTIERNELLIQSSLEEIKRIAAERQATQEDAVKVIRQRDQLVEKLKAKEQELVKKHDASQESLQNYRDRIEKQLLVLEQQILIKDTLLEEKESEIDSLVQEMKRSEKSFAKDIAENKELKQELSHLNQFIVALQGKVTKDIEKAKQPLRDHNQMLIKEIDTLKKELLEREVLMVEKKGVLENLRQENEAMVAEMFSLQKERKAIEAQLKTYQESSQRLEKSSL